MFEFRSVNGHIEVFDQYGDFLFSADTMGEAYSEAYAACPQPKCRLSGPCRVRRDFFIPGFWKNARNSVRFTENYGILYVLKHTDS